jgi:hypothetical protein
MPIEQYRLRLPRGWRRILRTPDLMMEEFAKALAGGLEAARRTAVESYLSGPRPIFLAPRSRRLKRNVGKDVKKIRWIGRYRIQGIFGIPQLVWYGMLHELGMSGVGKYGQQWGFPPKPFLKPALTDEFPTILRYLERAGKVGFEKAGGTKGV